jgi:hypothetical protein
VLTATKQEAALIFSNQKLAVPVQPAQSQDQAKNQSEGTERKERTDG